MQFRADIQILRGISVLLVVLFHLGFDFFRSGFLGVDVFFVISGFLMAVLYNPEDKLGFFKRRATRLLPAYYTIIILTLIFSIIYTTRNESVQVFEQAYYGSIFASNIGFWAHSSYFSDSFFNPLLHLWSLGVEIQFYLMIPFMAFFFRKSKWFLVIFLSISLALCFWATTISPKTSFFITPFRFWEFLIGYGVALFFTQSGNVRIKSKRYLGGFGLIALLIVPLLPVDGESLSFVTGHPGIFALGIAVATALVLAYGIPKQVEQSLAGKGLVILGKHSYSIYLVHFPIIVIYNNEPFGGTTYGTESISDLLILAAIIFVASFLLHRLVEIQRLPTGLVKRWRTVVFAASASIVILTISFGYFQLNNLKKSDQLIFAADLDRSKSRCGKIFRALNPTASVCELTDLPKSSVAGSIMLAGNSHANSAKEVFIDLAKENNLNLYFFVSTSTMNRNGHSSEFIVNQAIKNDVSVIFVHQHAASFDYATLESLVSIAGEHDIKIVYLEPVPVWDNEVPKSMWIMDSKNSNEMLLEKDIESYYSENNGIFNTLDTIEADNFSRIEVGNIFCHPDCQFKSEEGAPLYYDKHHLTEAGSVLLYPSIEQSISSLIHGLRK